MTVKEIDEMIDWCRKKIKQQKQFRLTGKRYEGYKEAMLCTMSYLHNKKRGEGE